MKKHQLFILKVKAVPSFFKKFWLIYTLTILVIFVLSSGVFIAIELILNNKIDPNIYIGDINVSLLTKNEAYQIVTDKFNQKLTQPLVLTSKGKKFSINLSGDQINIDYTEAVDEAFSVGHSGNWLNKVQDQWHSLLVKTVIQPQINLSLDSQLNQIAQQIYQAPQDATVWLDKNNSPNITPGQNGQELDTQKLQKNIKQYLISSQINSNLPIKQTPPNFTDTKAKTAEQALANIKQAPVKLTYNNQNWTIDVPTLYHLLNLDGTTDGLLNIDLTNKYVSDIATNIDQPVQQALFKFNSQTNRVEQFQPGQAGEQVDVDQTIKLITSAINSPNNQPITLPVNVVQPQVKTADINNLGINVLLGRGISNFAGSIDNRIYNVNLTAAKINGVLIPPGETFSFDQTVGDISAATGFKQAYVITNGRTVLGDGGGVCQVSTTVFRAALNAGVPITDRTAHAYRVGYYEQGFPPGIDATVFYPSVDFKFKNDTPAYMLLEAYTQGLTLYVDLYGTSDGRVATLTKPVVTDQTPPPPELRQDDPTLPQGTVQQTDFAAWGAKVSFNRTVTRNGQTIINETWNSNYRPWQAVFLVGTKT